MTLGPKLVKKIKINNKFGDYLYQNIFTSISYLFI